jgi:putative ABC transport system ATP-binding protein
MGVAGMERRGCEYESERRPGQMSSRSTATSGPERHGTTGQASGADEPVAATRDALIWLAGVTKRYEGAAHPAVDDVSLTVESGQAVAVMGPSGSGKSTLLSLIAGLDKPSGGAVTVAGERVDEMGETAVARFRRREIGMIFQFFNLLEDLTVQDNVLLPAQLAGVSRGQARARAGELLARLGIERCRDSYPGRLSGGERQRVAIARALVNFPALLLADEPTGAVDTATGEEIGRLLLELNQEGQTLVLVTHSPELASRYAERTVRLVDGRVVSDTAVSGESERAQEVRP